MIILGDAGINFSGGIRDMRKKEFLESLPITVFAIHGNHEQRPQTIEGYQEKVWHGGVVYQEEEYPSLLFAKDGEVFELTTDPDAFQQVFDALEKAGYKFVSAQVEMVPQTYVTVDGEGDRKNLTKMLEMFEDNDDVQNVWHNWENPDE